MDISAITYSVFLPLLNFIHVSGKSIGLESFGWSIVLLTGIIKLILTPLTFKQIKSTKKMQKVQPKLKALQEDFRTRETKHKDHPENLNKVRLEFQQKMMGFYKEHDVNPLGGCLPLIIQMPILLGLFWTFSGPPFQAKPIYVDLKVVIAAEASRKEIKPATKGEIYVDAEGRRARIAINTKGLTLVEGENYKLSTSRIIGDAELAADAIKWAFQGSKATNVATIQAEANGKVLVTALKAGSARIEALLPATVTNDSFFFIDDFSDSGVIDKETGKFNLDIFILACLFGLSIWFASKVSMPSLPPAKPGEVEDAQVAMQRSMATMMPIMMTGMMFFIPLPAGALLYMVVSSIIQAGQTYFAMERYKHITHS